MKSVRNHQAYWAFLGHRLSGLALALFLPVHFYVLGMALDEARFDRFLKLSDMPAMKVGEWGWSCCWRCTCASACLLALELLPWRSTRNARNGWIGWGLAVSMGIGLVFIAGVI